jgi:mannose-binding lectin
MSSILFAETAGTMSTAAGMWTPIPSLQFELPPSTDGQTRALITLCLPNPYASGDDFPGGLVGISVNGAVLVPIGGFTAESKRPESFGRKPVTLVVRVRLLAADPQAVSAVWQAVRSSTVVIDTPASLSAVLA